MSDLARRPLRITFTLPVVAAVVAAVLLLGDLDANTGTEAPAAAPRSVSPEEFCASYERLNMAAGEHLAAPTRQTTQDLKAGAAEVADLVDRTEMPDDAKAGVAFFTKAILGFDDVATAEDMRTFDDHATLRDSANARALGTYIADNCVARVEKAPK